MYRLLIILGVLLLLLSASLWGQVGTTTVTAQVKDANGSLYVNCQWSATFVGENTSPNVGPYAPASLLNGQQGTCDSQGNLSVNLADNVNTVTPTPSQWSLSICSAQGYPAGPYCKANILITVTGAAQSLTSTLTPLMPLLPPFGGAGSVPGGTNTQIQFNNAGTFGGISQQGTDGHILTSGTVSGTGADLCTDANGGATTSGCAPVTSINPTNNIVPARQNSTTFADTPLSFTIGSSSSTTSRGISFTDPTITQGGTPGSTNYFYCVVATDVFSSTRSTCFNTALGNATLNSTNFNTITVAAYSSTSPYLAPVGSCDVRRVSSSGSPSSLGKIGTIASCASGGSLNDTGLAGDATSTPAETSGVLTSVGPADVGQVYIYSDEVGMFLLGGITPGQSITNTVSPGYTHSVIVGGGSGTPYANSGITAVGWNGSGSAHACTAIGYGITCNSDSGFFAGISAGSSGGGSGSVAILGTTTNGNEVVVGNGSTAGGESVAIGHGASAGFTNAVALGKNAAATAINQAVIGGPNVTDFYAGNISSGNSTASYHALNGMLSGNWNCSNVTPVTANANSAADQNLMACSIPAGVLNRVGETLRIHTKTVYTTPAASVATLTFKAKLCDTSGCATGNVSTLVSITSTANAGSISNDPVLFDVEGTTQQGGATSRFEASGDLLIDLAATTTAAVTVFNDTNTATIAGSPSDLNINNALFLQITVAFSVANGSNTAIERQLVVDTVN